MSDSQHFETRAVRTQSERTSQREHSVPIYATSSFVFDDAEQARALFANEREGNIYSRFSNPNTDEFVQKMCLLEGTEDGMAMASGMAAMFVSMAAFLSQGDHLVMCRSVFGSTHQIATELFPRWGIEHTYVDIHHPEDWEKAIKPNTRMIFLETPSNPGLDVIDLEFAGKLARAHSILLNVDNCFATPYIQNPALFGADIVTHSATKFIDGQGRVLGGVVLGSKENMEKVRFFARHTDLHCRLSMVGYCRKAWRLWRYVSDRHCENAMKLAEYLEQHNDVAWVKYPFLKSYPNYDIATKQMKLGGGMVTFEIQGGLERGRKFLDSLQMLSFTANLGDTRSTATHPASTTHSKLTPQQKADVGITDGTVRISVGLEHIDDIIADIDRAIKVSKNG